LEFGSDKERALKLDQVPARLQEGPLVGFVLYDCGPIRYLECWDCGDPLVVHVEGIRDGRLSFHVLGSDVLRSVPTSWVEGVVVVESVEGGNSYGCLSPPWVENYGRG